jgi:CRP/FNR family transcriptional regulator, cyclic AMP receptor protein
MAYTLRVVPKKKHRVLRVAKPVKAAPQLQAAESWLSSSVLKDYIFCDFPRATLEGLDSISSHETHSKGAILFVEGQEPRGAFVICHGRVKLSAASADGRSLILRIAEAGEVVGLASTISGKPYEVTAKALEPVEANFLPRNEFLGYLREHGDAALRVAEMLSHTYHATYQEVKHLGLSSSAAEKLARFILNLTDSRSRENGAIRAQLTLTHEEIAEMIGSSRETVTRLFASFKRKQLVELHRSTLIVRSRPGLEELVGD